MFNIKKTFALMFALLLLATVFASCKTNEPVTSKPKDDVSQTVSQADPLEHLKGYNYNGAEIVFLVEGDHRQLYRSSDVLGSEIAPDVIVDAVDARNKRVEELLNIKIKEFRTDATTSMVDLVRTSANVGDNAYDVIMPYIPDAAAMLTEGLLSDLNKYDIFRFNNDYWDGNANKYFSVGGKLFFATGDMTLLAFDCTHALVFNKTVLERFDINENPYELVKQGKWTLDKLLEMAAKVTSDTDGDNKMTYKDTWGFFINSNYATSLFLGSGLTLTGRDSEDMPTIAIASNASAAADAVGKIVNAFSNERTTILIESFIAEANASGSNVWAEATKAVAENRALFRSMAIIDMNDLADFEVSYGILPTPKMSESQPNYHSFVSTIYASSLAIPARLDTKERSAVVIEAMSAASGDVKNKYYEVLLKGRRIADEDSSDMLDIIFNNRVYDLGVIYGWGGTSAWDPNTLGNFINEIAKSGENTFASTYARIEGAVRAAMEQTIDTIKAIDF